MEKITLDRHPTGKDFIADVNPTLNSRIKKIQSLDMFDKAKIYWHYFLTQLALKNDFVIIDTPKKGWSNPNKTVKGVDFYYLWKDTKINNMDEFYSEQNIEIRDCGENWKEGGFAQRWWIQCFGAYDWFWKFKNEINLD